MSPKNRFAEVACLILIFEISILKAPSSLLIAEEPERYIAIDNVAAWPNLTVLNDGSLIATIHNKAVHGRAHESDVECWASTDGGRFWVLRGVPAPHEPGTGRVNVAAGLAHDGTLIVLSSGLNVRTGEFLPVWVCRSSDGGMTWHHSASVRLPSGADFLIPFGDVQRLAGKTLAAPMYWEQKVRGPEGLLQGNSYLLFSQDDGLTWGEAKVMAPDHFNETAVLRLRSDRWLAAARAFGDGGLDMFVSNDEGQTWEHSGPLTLPSQHPGHLLRLADGRVLLTYGVREQDHQGIAVRTSGDDGHSWSPAIWIVHLESSTDVGYPSTVQIADGTLVTAYYSNGIPQHQRYHMGVVRWGVENLKLRPYKTGPISSASKATKTP